MSNGLIPFIIKSGEPTEGNRIRYYDYDGTLLKTQYVKNGGKSTPPDDPNPDPDFLIFKEWTHTESELSNIQYDIDVGATYDTVDNKTYLFCVFDEFDQPTLYLNSPNSVNITIDWGDGEIYSDIISIVFI